MLNYEFQNMQEKIDKFCDENDLQFIFESSKFPIVATINPTREIRDQMRLNIEELEEETNFVNGEIKFIFGDELTMTVLNDFRIEDSILNRIKNMTKKLHYLFLQNYFKEKVK